MERDREDEGETIGRVKYRSRPVRPREAGDHTSLPDALEAPTDATTTPNAYSYESFVPLRTESNNARRPASSFSEADLLPPGMAANGVVPPEAAQESSWFKRWLTTGIIDLLGITLSTTGKIVAPPLQMTRSILLPGMLALMVDTLDAITPPRAQDWFRIISSSVCHLVEVLSHTEKGKIFSNQLYVVLQDILQAISAPESRQVLVDGMASSVKFADALNTPEMMEFLEQLSTLGVRLLDAASSGKAKQLMQDTKDMAWKGIEMATDPSMTLALAEVTAHLCHALEDAQQSLNPTPRNQRNAQNQSVYLNPYQMADFPEQVTMEEIILSCLGRVEDNRKEAMGDDGASLPSRLTLDDDLSTTEPEASGWKERKDQVNVKLLREKILNEKFGKARMERPATAPVGSDIPAGEEKEVDDSEEQANIGDNATVDEPRSRESPERKPETDMEDISWSRVPGGRLLGLRHGDKQIDEANADTPALQRFYRRLDELLEQDRQRLEARRAERSAMTINNTLDEGETIPSSSWKGTMRKIREKVKSRVVARTVQARARDSVIPRKYYNIIVTALVVFAFLSFVLSVLAMYGLYSLVLKGHVTQTPRNLGSRSANQDVVIRIVREIVHVAEDGSVLRKSDPEVLAQEELDKISQNLGAAL